MAQAADETRVPNGVRLNLPNSDKILYNAYTSLSETPALARNNLMTRTLTLSLAARPVRYSA
ncbi:Phage tail protein [compost metagenome]